MFITRILWIEKKLVGVTNYKKDGQYHYKQVYVKLSEVLYDQSLEYHYHERGESASKIPYILFVPHVFNCCDGCIFE